MSDLRVALRVLLKDKRFTLVAVATLSVAIGACSALFAIYDRLVLNPITIGNPSTLVAVLNNNPQLPAPLPSVSWPRYEYLREHATTLASIAVSSFDNFTLTGNGDPDQLAGLRVSASFLPTLQVAPARGRIFTAEEEQPNGPAVCLISHELWQGRFGGRESIVGETITLNTQSWQVIGVTPPRMSPPFRQVQIFAPRVFEVTGLTAAQVQAGAGYTQVIARLRPGVSIAQARTELSAVSRAYREEFPARLDAQNTSEPRAYVEFLVGGLQPTFYTLLGAVAFVLIIACANISSLFLSRVAARHQEIAVRQSLGAARGRVVRQFLVESLTFSTIAGVLGAAVGVWTLKGVQALISAQLPPNTALTMTWRAWAVTTGITFACAVLVGLAPAWQATRVGLTDALKDRARGSTGERGSRLRSLLIVSEVALSIVLLVGATLLLSSFVRLQRTPPGFDPKGAGAAFVGLPAARYQTPVQQADFFARVIDRLRAHPAVVDAAAAIGLPVSGFNPRSPYSVAGRPILPLSQRPLAGLAIVSEGYFNALGITLVAGRAFTAEDRAGAPGVCIINESLARRLFPEESALGHVLLRGRDAEISAQIVGVIRDVRTLGLTSPAPDEIYFPMRQLGRPSMAVVARTNGDPADLQAILRTAVAGIDRDQPISFFATLDANLAQSVGVQRIVASLTTVFAGLALVLAAVGLYSVIAYVVSQRTNEIGIRMALGAQTGQVVGLVMRSGLRLVAAGVVIGLAAAAGVAHLIRTLLFQVQPLDVRIYGGVAALFVLVGVVACLLPSRRASRIDPVLALRR